MFELILTLLAIAKQLVIIWLLIRLGVSRPDLED